MEYFNQPVDRLPPSLTHLVLGHYYNHPLDHLPSNLRSLLVGHSYQQTVQHLPPSITHVLSYMKAGRKMADQMFGRHKRNFNFPLENLPPSLTHLVVGCSFNRNLISLPPNLKSLTIGCSFEATIFAPSSLYEIIQPLDDVANVPEPPDCGNKKRRQPMKRDREAMKKTKVSLD
jgi:FNIP Repeat